MTKIRKFFGSFIMVESGWSKGHIFGIYVQDFFIMKCGIR